MEVSDAHLKHHTLLSAMENLRDFTTREGLFVFTLAIKRINIQVHGNTLEP
jgi:hypothetical protein